MHLTRHRHRTVAYVTCISSCLADATELRSVKEETMPWCENSVRHAVLSLLKHHSQSALAKLSPLSQSTISTIANGRYKNRLSADKCREFGVWYTGYLNDTDYMYTPACVPPDSRLTFHPDHEVPVLRRWFHAHGNPTADRFSLYAAELNKGLVRQDRPQVTADKVRMWWKNERQREKRIKAPHTISTQTVTTTTTTTTQGQGQVEVSGVVKRKRRRKKIRLPPLEVEGSEVEQPEEEEARRERSLMMSGGGGGGGQRSQAEGSGGHHHTRDMAVQFTPPWGGVGGGGGGDGHPTHPQTLLSLLPPSSPSHSSSPSPTKLSRTHTPTTGVPIFPPQGHHPHPHPHQGGRHPLPLLPGQPTPPPPPHLQHPSSWQSNFASWTSGSSSSGQGHGSGHGQGQKRTAEETEEERQQQQQQQRQFLASATSSINPFLLPHPSPWGAHPHPHLLPLQVPGSRSSETAAASRGVGGQGSEFSQQQQLHGTERYKLGAEDDTSSPYTQPPADFSSIL